MKKKQRHSDPHAKRESENYANPLPSREFILATMTQQGVPLSVERLYELLEIHETEREIFNQRLSAMEREGQIMRNRKGALCIAEKLHLISGKVQGHADGFGFLIPDNGGDDLFVHFSAIASQGFKTLDEGQKVTFDIETDKRNGKLCATNVNVAQPAGTRA